MTHRVDELGDYEFNTVAQWAADQLAAFGACWVDLQPGDATTYKIVVVYPMARNIRDGIVPYRQASPWVGTSFGPLHPWNPEMHVDWDYVNEKWVPGMRGHVEHTARVIARFLNILSDKMKETGNADG